MLSITPINANEDIFIEEQKIENSENIDKNLGIINIEDKEVKYESKISLEIENQNTKTHNVITVNGTTYDDINATINLSQPGDIIILGAKTYTARAGDTVIWISTPNLTITGSNTIDGVDRSIIDGNYMINMFYIDAINVTIKNIDFINSYIDDDDLMNVGILELERDLMNVRTSAVGIGENNSKIYNCTFTNCGKNITIMPKTLKTPLWYGGGVSSLHSAQGIEIIGCNFTDCFVINNANGTVKRPASAAGGAAGIYGNNSLIQNCNFTNCYVFSINGTAAGGAIQIGMDNSDYTVSIISSYFSNNFAKALLNDYAHGGSICMQSSASYLINTTILNSQASEGGGVTVHAKGDIINCTIANNTAMVYGGGLSTGFRETNFSNVVNVISSIFSNNNAPFAGATQINGYHININNTIFSNNNATGIDGLGGAIVVNGVYCFIDNSSFVFNEAVYGGAGYIQGNTTTILNSSFIGNEARVIDQNHDGVDGLGGAIYILSENNKIIASYFNHNKARNGSAIYNNGHIEIEDTEFILNQAWSYHLVMSTVHNITYGDTVDIYIVLVGGDNIHHPNPNISNAIYHNNTANTLSIDGVNPVLGAVNSNQGSKLYQDGREPHSIVDVVIIHEETGEVVFNGTVITDYLGAAAIFGLKNGLVPLRIGNYTVYGNHPEDMNYKEISNFTSFKVISGDLIKEPNKNVQNIGDNATWNISFYNNGTKKVNVTITDNYNPDEMKYLGSNIDPISIKDGIIVWELVVDVGETIYIELYTQLIKEGILQNNITNGHEFAISFVAVMMPTITTITTPDEILVGETIEIEATLTDKDDKILANKTVELFIDGVSIGNFTTNENGIVKTTHKFTQTGEYKMEAKFNGHEIYLASNGTDKAIVAKIPTNIDINVPQEIVPGSTVEVEVTLTDKDGNVLANKTVELFVNGVSIGNFTTNENGIIKTNHTFTQEGEYKVEAKFNGDEIYKESTGTNNTVVDKIKTITKIIVEDDKIIAIVTDLDGNPVEGVEVIFTMNGKVIGVGTTDANGIAILFFEDAYKNTITATFEGNDRYAGSSATYKPAVDPVDPVNPTEKDSTNVEEIANASTMAKTGNPVALVLIALITLFSTIGFRKKE
ncbi:Ig-like domain repeat protein [Methanobrevibacter sp. DSM 116169]|uniref:Ig-like domain repeat protein n=1 Tax=Methanobrevibacter sp. DSM 116169 TaxID=3242727 RepID=UPI0038FC7019